MAQCLPARRVPAAAPTVPCPRLQPTADPERSATRCRRAAAWLPTHLQAWLVPEAASPAAWVLAAVPVLWGCWEGCASHCLVLPSSHPSRLCDAPRQHNSFQALGSLQQPRSRQQKGSLQRPGHLLLPGSPGQLRCAPKELSAAALSTAAAADRLLSRAAAPGVNQLPCQRPFGCWASFCIEAGGEASG